MPGSPTIPINIPPMDTLEDVRHVLSNLITSINAALANFTPTSFGGQRLSRVGQPVAVDDAATKNYVDNAAATAVGSGSGSSPFSMTPIAVNIVPKSGGGGRLVPSSITDNGAVVKLTERELIDIGVSPVNGQFLTQANGNGALGMLCFAADNSYLTFDQAWQNSQFIASNASVYRVVKNNAKLNFQVASGQTIGSAVTGVLNAISIGTSANVGFGGNVTPGFAVDVTGDCNVSGVYRVGTTPGQTTTVTFIKSFSVVGTSTSFNFGTLTFSGGIETANS